MKLILQTPHLADFFLQVDLKDNYLQDPMAERTRMILGANQLSAMLNNCFISMVFQRLECHLHRCKYNVLV